MRFFPTVKLYCTKIKIHILVSVFMHCFPLNLYDVHVFHWLTVKLNGGRQIQGILRGFDPFMNLVVDESIEETKLGERNSIGMVVGSSWISHLRLQGSKLTFSTYWPTRPVQSKFYRPDQTFSFTGPLIKCENVSFSIQFCTCLSMTQSHASLWAASSEKGAYGNFNFFYEVHFSFRLL